MSTRNATSRKPSPPLAVEELPLPADDLPLGDEAGLPDDSAPLERPEAEDPFAAVEYTGSVEADSLVELAALKTAFGQRAAAERGRFVAATDSEYWCCLAFQTRAQKERFLQAMGWIALGDKYLDGVAVAARQGIELPPASVPFVAAKPDAALTALSLPLPSEES